MYKELYVSKIIFQSKTINFESKKWNKSKKDDITKFYKN